MDLTGRGPIRFLFYKEEIIYMYHYIDVNFKQKLCVG